VNISYSPNPITESNFLPSAVATNLLDLKIEKEM
jgi:hypothetical protein